MRVSLWHHLWFYVFFFLWFFCTTWQVFLLLQDILLLLLFRGGQPHGLLPLIIHHLLHHTARLTVQIWQLSRFHLKTQHGMKVQSIILSYNNAIFIRLHNDPKVSLTLNMPFEINPWSKTSYSWLGNRLLLPWNSLGKFFWCWSQGLWSLTCSTTPFCLSEINVYH